MMQRAHPLRLSGRARGVDDVGGVVGREGDGGRGCGIAGDRRPFGVEADDAGIVVAQAIAQARMGHDDAGARIAQHVGEPLGRVVGIEWQVGAARLEDAEEPDDHLHGAFEAQPHHHLGTDAEAAQVMRQPVGARVELRVGEACSPNTTAVAAGDRADLRGEQRRHGGERNRARRVVPGPDKSVALLGRQNVEPPDRLLRLPTTASNSRTRRPDNASMLARSNRSPR